MARRLSGSQFTDKQPRKTAVPVELDKGDLRRVELFLGHLPNRMNQVMVRSLNKTIRGAQTVIRKEVTAEVPIPQKKVSQTLKHRKVTAGRLEGYVRSTSGSLGLIWFKARQTKKGVTVQMEKGGGRDLIPGAFILSISGTKNVFWRKKTGWERTHRGAIPGLKYGALPRKYRLPMQRLIGPRVPDVIERPHVFKRIGAGIDGRLRHNINYELTRELKRG